MTFVDRGQGADVTIGGLPFKLAINSERPYERATAQFRKEQFDSAPTVGDQSLTGWWTRGQLSFHKGAGLKYYEVLDGDAVLDRYHDSDSVEVSTPGAVSLMPSLSDLSVSALDAVPAPLSAGGGVYVLTDTGVQYTAGGAASLIDTSDSAVPTSITSSGDLYYVANGTFIEQQFDGTVTKTNHVTNPSFETGTTGWSGSGSSLAQTNYVTNPSFETNTTSWSGAAQGAVVRTNLITNPSFETNVTGWTATGGTATQGAFFASGSKCITLTATAATVNLGVLTADYMAVTAEHDYTLSASVRSHTTNGENDVNVAFKFFWYDASNSLVDTDDVLVGLDSVGVWTRYSATAQAPTGATKCKVSLRYWSFASIDSGDVHYLDAIMLEEGDLLDYFDGATTDGGGITYDWTGTAHLSSATATYSAPTATLTSSATQAKDGTKSLNVVSSVAPHFPVSTAYTVTGLTNGVAYKVLAWVYLDPQGRQVQMKAVSTVLDTSTTEDDWELLQGTFTATGTSAVITFEHTGTGSPAGFYVDAVLWTQSPYYEGYFDGDTADGTVTYAWTGTPHASTSTASDADTVILESSTAAAKYGTKSLYVADEHGREVTLTSQTTVSGLTIGVDYLVSGWVYLQGGAGTSAVALYADSTQLDISPTTTGDWHYLSGTFEATATSHVLKFEHDGAGRTITYYIDAILWTEDPYAGSYFDGSQPGAAWVGTPHASKSTWGSAGDGTDSAVLITLTGAGWVDVWWAKGRLWAVDDEGYWYALPAVTATVDNTNAFWNSGKTGISWSLAQGTGPVYISDGFDIYTVTVATDGVVPTITTPTTAARMPLGEQIATISYYLGYIIIATTRGVRVALTQEDQVLLGPLVIKGDFSGTARVGAFDTRAYVVGRPDDRGGDNVLCQVDLGQFVTDLVPAWAPLATISDLGSTSGGALVDSTGKLYAWAAEVLLAASRDEKAAEGYLETGFHRFGTLEPKHFQSVLVRLGGTGGSVEVSRVDADGTETSLSTITLPVTAAQDVALGLTSPVEMIGLRFTLTRGTDPTLGPELLGYQLRAMPAPKRQRMIRVPLELKDTERRGGPPAGGYRGSAWDRLEALEEMEATGSVVAYKDLRTGEEADVFVESVEHKGVTPPGANSSGFGGIVFLTMRRL